MLNNKAYRHALNLIERREVNSTDPWSFSAEDGDALLGDPPDWSGYELWFLMKDPNANPASKEAYKYPYGKNGKVYRSALTAIRQRAAQQDEFDLYSAAGRLIEAITKEGVAKLGFVASMSDENGVPSSFQVFPFGIINIKGSDPILVDDAAMDEVVRAFDARGIDMVIDYEHQTEGGDYASPDGKAPAAGWVKKLENRGPDGLWAHVEWTDSAREMLSKREYRYYSPVFSFQKRGGDCASS